MVNPNTAISMEKCIPIPLDEKQQAGEEKSDQTSLVHSTRNRKISSNDFNRFVDRQGGKVDLWCCCFLPQTSKGLTDRCFSDRKTTLLTLAILFLIGLSCVLFFGRKTDQIKLTPEESYAFGNYMIQSTR